MKKINISLMGLALLAILLVAPAAQADIVYTELRLYNFTVQNPSSMGDSHPYLWKVELEFENYANVTLLNNPANWTVGTYDYSPLSLNETIETGYLEMYSDAIEFDVLPGALLALSFIADYQLGEITYELWFSDHGTPEDWTTIPGTASPVPVPAAVWLLGTGLAGLVGIRRKMVR